MQHVDIRRGTVVADQVVAIAAVEGVGVGATQAVERVVAAAGFDAVGTVKAGHDIVAGGDCIGQHPRAQDVDAPACAVGKFDDLDRRRRAGFEPALDQHLVAGAGKRDHHIRAQRVRAAHLRLTRRLVAEDDAVIGRAATIVDEIQTMPAAEAVQVGTAQADQLISAGATIDQVGAVGPAGDDIVARRAKLVDQSLPNGVETKHQAIGKTKLFDAPRGVGCAKGVAHDE